MSEITHPTIKGSFGCGTVGSTLDLADSIDRWMVPQNIEHVARSGQAMTLKVNQVLHHEKSKYQDVLIFESSDHGVVLVLDNVIQCSERDKFS